MIKNAPTTAIGSYSVQIKPSRYAIQNVKTHNRIMLRGEDLEHAVKQNRLISITMTSTMATMSSGQNSNWNALISGKRKQNTMNSSVKRSMQVNVKYTFLIKSNL